MSGSRPVTPAAMPSIVGRRLRQRREQLGWSLERVGVAIGLEESSARARISRYELGVHQPPEAATQALAQALAAVQPAADRLFEQHDYTGSLQALAALKAPVDAFFDAVMVNAEDPGLRANRQALLAGLHAAMNRVADLSRLAA